MKAVVIAVIIAVMLLDGIICFCLLRAGAEQDRWMEEHPFPKERDAQNGKERLDEA